MSAYSLSGAFGIRLQARQIVSQFDCYLAVDLADGLDQDEAPQIAPEAKPNQPSGRGNTPATPHFSASVTCLDGFSKADGGLCRSCHFRLGFRVDDPLGGDFL